MPFSVANHRWRRQPTGLLAPNPAVLSRPVALWDARHATDLVGSSRNLSRVGSPQNTVAGVAFRTSSSTGNRFDTGGRLPSSSRYKPTGDVTFAVYFIKRSSAGSSQRMGGCMAGTDGFSLGEVYGLNYSYANIGGTQMGLSSLWPLDTPVVAIVTKRGSTGRFFVNGVLHGSSSSVGSMSYDASFASFFWGGNVDGGPQCTTDLLWLAVDNVGWSDDRCRDLCRDPWSVFAPERRPVVYSLGGATNYTLAADAGAYTLTGGAATLRVGRRLTAAAGSFALTGGAAGLYVARRLSADAAAYTFVGNDATLTYSAGATNYTLTADAGSLAFTGGDATLRVGRVLSAAQGAYSVTGNAASFARTYRLSADAGAYSLIGNAANLLYSGAESSLWTPQTLSDAAWTPQSASAATWTPQ